MKNRSKIKTINTTVQSGRPKSEDAKKTKSRSYGFDLDAAVQYVLTCKQQAEDELRGIRSIQDLCWEAYCNQQDFSKKKDWQSKIYLPELYPAVKKATSLLRRILFRARKVFDLVDPVNEGLDLPEIAGQEKIIQFWLDRIRWLEILGQAVESGLVLGEAIIKLWWEPYDRTWVELNQETKVEEEEDGRLSVVTDVSLEKAIRHSSRLAASVIDPRRVYYDQDRTFFIERSYLPYHVLESLARAEEGKIPLFDIGQVRKLKTMSSSPDENESIRRQSLNIGESSNAFQHLIPILEFHGDLLNEKGEVVIPRAYLVVANDEVVINPHRPQNPYDFFGILEGAPPYIHFSPFKMLFRHTGRSMIEGALSLQKGINQLINMTMDGLLWKLNRLIEVDPDLIRNPDVLKNLAPGRPILKRGAEPAIREIPFSDVPQGAIASLEILRRALQNSNFITDVMLALNTRADTTATEVQVKTAEANALWETIGITIEQDLIIPFVEMTRQLIIINWDDFDDPVLTAMSRKYNLPLRAKTREERIQFLLRNIKIRTGAVSEYFHKMEELRALLEFMGVFAKIPPMYQRLNLRKLADRILGNFGFPDAHELIISEEEEKKLAETEKAAELARAQNLASQAALNAANVEEMRGTKQPPGQPQITTRPSPEQAMALMQALSGSVPTGGNP